MHYLFQNNLFNKTKKENIILVLEIYLIFLSVKNRRQKKIIALNNNVNCDIKCLLL